MFLSRDQLADLTGYERTQEQRRWLDEQGYLYTVNASGRVILHTDEVVRKLVGVKKPPVKSINLTALS